MRLDKYLASLELTETAFARSAGLEISTVHRAARGKVVPSPSTMRAIVAATGGAVQPNDFFADLPVLKAGAGTGHELHSHDARRHAWDGLADGEEPSGRYRVGIDIGGTFTDLVVLDTAGGELSVAKVPTIPGNLWRGVADGLDRLGFPRSAMAMIVHGTTVGLNAFLERKGRATGLITTRGFRDVYEIARHNRIETYDLFYLKPQPLIPRRHRHEVRERTAADGTIIEPLVEEDVIACARRLEDAGIDAIAVCLLHSYANSEHEARIGEILAREYPRASVSLSHNLARQWREYERTSTTAINAYIMPVVGSYLEQIQTSLAEDGYSRPFFVSQSSGGIMSVDAAKTKPVQTIMSGPAGGAAAAAFIGGLCGYRNVISFDMGGTSTDVSLIYEGKLRVTDESALDRHPLMVSMIEIKSIGAGGGSIARVDATGALNVGPQSAGADPGPVCYGKGGEEPTVTDANLVLGRLSPSHFLDGEMTLDLARACQKVETQIAERLGLGLTAAANGIVEVINAKMAYAVRAITVERGLDPKNFILLAFGGAGPMHACAVARNLHIPEIVVPIGPGAFSAFGMLVGDVRHDFVQTHLTAASDRSTLEPVDDRFREMVATAKVVLTNEGVAAAAMRFERLVDIRYVGQEYTVTVPLLHETLDEAAVVDVRRRFHWMHERSFGHASPGEPTEIVNLRVTAIGNVDRPVLSSADGSEMDPAGDAHVGDTEAFFAIRETALRVPLYRRDRLSVGNRITGPAIVVEKTATTVVEPGFWLEVMPQGHLRMKHEP